MAELLRDQPSTTKRPATSQRPDEIVPVPCELSDFERAVDPRTQMNGATNTEQSRNTTLLGSETETGASLESYLAKALPNRVSNGRVNSSEPTYRIRNCPKERIANKSHTKPKKTADRNMLQKSKK